MKSTPTLFFATAALFAICGMVWGVQMSASHNYTLAPAHGHLNLLGFVGMAVSGAYYGLTPRAAGKRLAFVHYWLTATSVLVLIPGIVLALTERGEVLAQIGSLLAVASMVLFTFIILRNGVGDIVAKG